MTRALLMILAVSILSLGTPHLGSTEMNAAVVSVHDTMSHSEHSHRSDQPDCSGEPCNNDVPACCGAMTAHCYGASLAPNAMVEPVHLYVSGSMPFSCQQIALGVLGDTEIPPPKS